MARKKEWNPLAEEKLYLRHLGKGKWRKSLASRIDLLRNYIETTPKRTEPWMTEAVKYAEALLQKELKTQSPA